jgi:hypothetical protein
VASTGNIFAGTGENLAGIGATAWTNPGNIVSDNATDATNNGSSSNYLVARNYGFSVPGAATIAGITVRIELSEHSPGSETLNARLQDENGALIGSGKTASVTGTTKTVYTYGSTSDLWGATLTPAIVNDVDFGVRFWFTTSHDIRVDYVTLAVEYTEGEATLTGSASTSEAGTATPDTSKAATGESGTTSAGSVTQEASAPLVGSAVTSSQGELVRSRGLQIDSAQGSVTPTTALSGSEITSEAGSVSVDTVGFNESLTGSDTTAAQGSPNLGASVRVHSRKVGGGSASRSLSGNSGAVSIGAVTPVPTKTPTSIAALLTAGNFGKTSGVPLTGTAASSSTGSVTAVGSVAFALSGPTSGTTGELATFTVTPNVALTAGGGVVDITAPGVTLSASQLTFAAGSADAQTFSFTPSTDGTTVVTISTPTVGMSVTGSPISYAASATLTTIGPATPEQIALFLPVADTVPYTATATCEYKRTADSTWTPGHPLYRIRNDINTTGAFGGDTLRHGFAWPIIDLQPGTSYDVKVTLGNGASGTQQQTFTTRSLPAVTGAANKTANSEATIRTQLAGLNPGDVLEIAAGTYNLTGSQFEITRSGTANDPIVIRGASRTGTILARSAQETFFALRDVDYVRFENFTIQGNGVDGGTVAFIGASASFQNYITIRNLVATGIDRFIYLNNGAQGVLVYNNTITGNNPWALSHLNTSIGWDDDGIHLPGSGNCAWQNTITGFGDTFAYCSHDSNQATANAVHYYRNEIRNSVDDVLEVDHAEACCTWYDNRVHNSINAVSLDPIYGGPFLSARNIYINTHRGRVRKWNGFNSGQFVYNETVISTESASSNGDDLFAAWYQPSGAQNSFGYRNNAHVYAGAGIYTVRHDSSGFGIVDWTHNSWYPDRKFNFNFTNGDTLALVKAAIAGGAARTPIFSGVTEFMSQDSICAANPWSTTITLPATSATAVSATYLPTPATGSALKNTGVSIPNITDGFTGSAPDRGAKIEGRAAVAYGDQTEVIPSWVPSTAWQWTQISGTQWDTVMSVAGGAPSQTGDPESSDYNTQWDFGGVAYSPKNHELWLFGGGHNGTTINALSRWSLGTSSPSVSMMCAPTPVATRLADWNAGAATWEAAAFHTAGGGAEARPKSPHAYLNNRYFDDIDEFISLGLAAVDNPSGAVTRYFACPSFPRSGSAWRAQGYFPDIENAGTYGPQNACVFESYDRAAVYYAGYNSPLYKITSAGVKSTIGSSLGDVYRAHGCAQSLTQALTVGGTDASNPQGYRAKFINLTTGVATTVTVSGYAWPANFQYFGLVWSSTPGKYIALLLDEGAGNPISIDGLRIVTLEPTGASTMTAANVTLTGTAPTHFKLSTAMHIDEAYGVLLFAMTPTQPLFAIKVS